MQPLWHVDKVHGASRTVEKLASNFQKETEDYNSLTSNISIYAVLHKVDVELRWINVSWFETARQISLVRTAYTTSSRVVCLLQASYYIYSLRSHTVTDSLLSYTMPSSHQE